MQCASADFDHVRLTKVQRGPSEAPHQHVRPHEVTRRVRPMRAFWILVGVAAVLVVLFLLLDQGADSDDERSAASRGQPATWGEEASSSTIAW